MSGWRYRMPERLSESLGVELDRLGVDGATLEATAAWESAVGPDIARNAWPARLKRDGTLVVHVRTSVWAFELTQMAEEIRMKLEPPPEGIRFVVGRVPEPTGLPPEEARRTPVEADPRSLEAAATLAAGLSSVELREVVEKAASLALSRGSSDRPV